MDESDNVFDAYDNHPYEDKMRMVKMLIEKMEK